MSAPRDLMSNHTQRIEVIKGLAVGGAETLLLLRLSRDRENDTTVLNTAPRLVTHPLLHGVRHVNVRHVGGPINLIKEIRRIARQARRVGQECEVIVHSPHPALIVKAARGLGIISTPVVQMVHSANMKPAYRALHKLTNRWAEGAIAVSEDVANSWPTRYFRSVIVAHGGVDMDGMLKAFTETSKDRLRQSLGITGMQRLFVAIGNLRAEKNHAAMLNSFERYLRQSKRDDVLVIFGEGPLRGELEALAEDLGIRRNVLLPGVINPAWLYLAAADAMLHTSRHEGLPVAFMEAAVAGVPVFSTTFPGSREAAELCENIHLCRDETEIVASLIVHPFGLRYRPNPYWGIDRAVQDFDRALRQIKASHARRRGKGAARRFGGFRS